MADLSHALILGDGDGAVNRLIAQFDVCKTIIYNSLYDITIFPADALQAFELPAFVDAHPGVKAKLQCLLPMLMSGTDLSSPRCCEGMEEAFSRQPARTLMLKEAFPVHRVDEVTVQIKPG